MMLNPHLSARSHLPSFLRIPFASSSTTTTLTSSPSGMPCNLTLLYATSVVVVLSPVIALLSGTVYVVTSYLIPSPSTSSLRPIDADDIRLLFSNSILPHHEPEAGIGQGGFSVKIHGFDVPVTPLGAGIFVLMLIVVGIIGVVVAGVENLVNGGSDNRNTMDGRGYAGTYRGRTRYRERGTRVARRRDGAGTP